MNTFETILFAVGLMSACSAHEYEHIENHVVAPYKYEYGVHDPHTGDIKEAKESGDGHGGVKGFYKLKEADGTERIVHYTADKHLGFIAHVTKIGHAYHPDVHHHEPHQHYPHHDAYSWTNAHVEPSHKSDLSTHNHQEAYIPHYHQLAQPIHKFDLHHDKHHGISHQYVALHH